MTDQEIYAWLLEQIADTEEELKKTMHRGYEHQEGICDGLKMVKRMLEDYGDVEREADD